MQRARRIVFSCLISASLMGTAALAQSAVTAPTKIQPQPLAQALSTFAKQTGLQLIYVSEIATGQQSNGAPAGLPAPETLTRLLEGTGLAFEFINERTVRIYAMSAVRPASTPTSLNSFERARNVMLAQADPNVAETAERGEGEKDERANERRQTALTELGEVVVTGTHIRGVTSSASPVHVYDRNDIDRAGVGSVAAFIQRVPQNFNGGASENTAGNITGGGDSVNSVGATGVNLRGLGNDATLVLINGQRVAPGNIRGNFVDISLIPLAAVDRIEIVPDGASAIYGSDAVGGVVNFILRQHFDGAETRARYGTVSEGGRNEFQVGQAMGHDWSTGSALLSYEYFDQASLSASDRSYTQAAREPFTLLPVQERHAAFLAAQQAVRPGLELFANASYARRSTVVENANAFSFARRPSEVDAYSGLLGANVDLLDRVQLELSGSYAASDTHQNTFLNGNLFGDTQANTHVLSVDAKVDGSLWSTPSGPIRFAVGGQYREESRDVQTFSVTSFDIDRDVRAAFVELRIPIVGPSSVAPGGNRLELTLADRDEYYSDFGSSNNPHIGLMWQPSPDLKFRGTYGESFKAPLLVDLNPALIQVAAFPQFDPLTGGNVNTLILFGGNPELNPETATSWTVGLDLQPRRLSALQANLTYYNIRFKNRITNPQFGVLFTDALRQESILGSEIVRRNPSAAEVQQLASDPAFFDFTGTPGGVDLATIAAIVDFRVHNLSSVNTSGIDFGVSYNTDVPFGRVETGLDATYMLKFDHQFTSASPTIDRLNTPFNPTDLRLRGRGVLTRGPLTFAAFLNYTDSYTDNSQGTSRPVASWTTADATMSYTLGDDRGLLSHSSLLLGITNITNKDPPFVASPFWRINYDGANANPLGRFYYVQLSKRFGTASQRSEGM